MTQLKNKRRPPTKWKKYLLTFFALSGGLISLGIIYREIVSSQWNGRSQFGWVDQQQEITVNLILPDEKKTVTFLLPGNIFTKLDFGLGECRLNKAFELGKLEEKGGRVLTRTVQNLLGIGVNAWKVGSKTNLSHWDQLRLRWHQAKNGKKEKIDILQSNALIKDYLEDGTEIYRVKTDKLSQLVHQEVFNEKIAQESLTVAVINASGADSAANDLSRLITNLGAEVVLIGNKEFEAKSYFGLVQKSLKDSKTVISLKQLIGISLFKDIDIKEYRSDILIIIGNDYTSL